MREQKERTIDGVTIRVQQLPAMRSVKLMHRLGRAIGPAMLQALAGADVKSTKDFANAKINMGAIGDAIGSAFDRFSEDDLERLTRELFETATVTDKGKEFPMMSVFDNVFAGKPGTVLKAIKFALEVNYQDFFGVLLESVGQLAASPSPSKFEESNT